MSTDSPDLPRTRGHSDDTDPLRIASRAGEEVRGVSTPNPPVGAVVLDVDGVVVGVGGTERAGGRHAEVVALDRAGERARGGTIVVTLEPCAHTGRTGPCTRRILDSGVRSVVYGCADPNPVAAGGAEVLRAAGLEVRQDETLRELSETGPLRAWMHRQRTDRPYVTWKYAASLDGYVAAADGSSRWITGSDARTFSHGIRERIDAIVVGTGTLVADDPSLTARRPDGTPLSRSPLACVMGTTPVPGDAAVRDSPGGFLHLPTHDPAEALGMIDERLDGALHVLVEGGPTVAGAFLSAGLVDEFDAYVAPMVLGGGRKITEGFEVATLAEATRFVPVRTLRLGRDVHTRLLRPIGTTDGDHDEGTT